MNDNPPPSPMIAPELASELKTEPAPAKIVAAGLFGRPCMTAPKGRGNAGETPANAARALFGRPHAA